jgi:hypothetical protein
MRNLIALGLLIGLAGTMLNAGPFGLRGKRGGNYYQPQQGSASYSSDGELNSAQGVCNRIARTGIFRHWGNPTGGFEGIGLGATPEIARRNCCYANSMTARDVGYAQMASGIWVACQRY